MAPGRTPTVPGTYGEIGVRQLDSGRWEANLQLRLLNGAVKRIRRSGKSQAEAKRRTKQAALAAIGTQDSDVLKTSSTVTALCDYHLARLDKSASTKRTYQSALDLHITPGIGLLRLNEVTTGTLDTFLRAQTPGTWKTCRALLSGAFRRATVLGVVQANPVRETASPPSTRPEARALTTEELRTVRLMAAHYSTGSQMGPAKRAVAFPRLIDVLAGTGLRISDALSLRWVDIDPEKAEATIHDVKSQGAKVRVIDLPKLSLAALKAQWAETGAVTEHVFSTGTGRPLTASNAERWMRKAKEAWKAAGGAQGTPDISWVTFHTFRRTVATLLAEKVSVDAATRQLGHTDSTVTEHHYLDRTVRAPAVAAVLDEALRGTGL